MSSPKCSSCTDFFRRDTVIIRGENKTNIQKTINLFLNGKMTTKQLKKSQGKIISNGVVLKNHEKDIVTIFTNLGYNVELIPTARRRQTKTADAIIDGLEWKFKTPHESSTRTLDRILRKAANQSNNVIVDLHALKVPDTIAIRRVKYVSKEIRKIQRLKVITKSTKIIDIK